LKQRLNCVLFCEDGDDTENKTDNDYEESGMEGGSMTRSRNELEEDAVEDYIDSDDYDVNKKNVNKRSDTNQKGLHEEETESKSDENGSSNIEENDDNDEDTDESDDDVSSRDDDNDGNVIASKRRRT